MYLDDSKIMANTNFTFLFSTAIHPITDIVLCTVCTGTYLETCKYLENFARYGKISETNYVQCQQRHAVPICILSCNDLGKPCNDHVYIFKWQFIYFYSMLL